MASKTYADRRKLREGRSEMQNSSAEREKDILLGKRNRIMSAPWCFILFMGVLLLLKCYILPYLDSFFDTKKNI